MTMELPKVELTDDQIRTIARDYVEHHGETDTPSYQEILGHLPDDFMEDGPKVPDLESMKLIASVIRRSVTRAELPAEIHKAPLVLSEEECRRYARMIVKKVGEQGDSDVVRILVSRDYDEELSEESIELIGELVDASDVLILLPGDAEYQPHVDIPNLVVDDAEAGALAWSSGKMTAEEMKEKFPEVYEAIKDQIPGQDGDTQ